MLEIDGSHGEGGGAILRTAVALAAVSGKACRITNIRAKRKNPGLQAQHATAVDAVAKRCAAEVKGNAIGSTTLEFAPHEIRGGSLSLNVGTAGSVALVLQALMIPAMHCKKPLDIKIQGGTMNRWAPTIGYMQNVTLAALSTFGYDGELNLLRHGFYPQGGGLVEAVIRPAQMKRIDMPERGELQSLEGSCIISKDLQKQQVAERMQKYARQRLFDEFQLAPRIQVEYVDSTSTGGGQDIFAAYEHAVIGSNAIAERGRRAEDVAKEAIDMLVNAHQSNAPVDLHVWDSANTAYLAGGNRRLARKLDAQHSDVVLLDHEGGGLVLH